MGFFGDLFGGKDPKTETKVMWDPLKKSVSTPMSSFLASNVGKGLPRYEGQMYEPLDKDTMNRYSEFMGLDAGSWFDKAVGDPETKRFKEELLPEITEGFAGNLRGSGRYRAEEAGISKFSESLAQTRAQAIPGIAGAQWKMGSERAAYEDVKYQREYTDWLKSLPEFNPVLDKAMAFLAGPTGRDVYTITDPGSKGVLGDIFSMIGDIGGSGAFNDWFKKGDTASTATGGGGGSSTLYGGADPSTGYDPNNDITEWWGQ